MDDNARMHEGLTVRLAALTLRVARGDIPGTAVEAARRLVQHAFGVAVAGSGLPVSLIARAALDDATGACLIFGSTRGHSAQNAAFANGVIGHASLLEDAGPGGMRAGSHPGTYIFPAALAVAQQSGASGMALIRAVCAAYEVVDRLGALMPGTVAQRGFRAVPVLGPFGAVAAAGVLWGLSAAPLAAAYGIAANLAGGLNQGFIDGTMEVYLQPGFAARNGLLAARLAQAGCAASPVSLEGERGFFATFAGQIPEAASFDAPASELSVCRVGTKDFATCLYNQGTLALVTRSFPHGLAAADIEHVILARPASGLHGTHAPGVAAVPPHRNALQSQMSARFTTAAALLGRPVDSALWFAQAPDDRQVAALAEKISLVTHDAPGIRIEVLLRDGRRELAETGGETALVFSSEQTAAAFTARVRPVLGQRSDEAAALMADLPRLQTLVRLTSLFNQNGNDGLPTPSGN